MFLRMIEHVGDIVRGRTTATRPRERSLAIARIVTFARTCAYAMRAM